MMFISHNKERLICFVLVIVLVFVNNAIVLRLTNGFI